MASPDFSNLFTQSLVKNNLCVVCYLAINQLTLYGYDEKLLPTVWNTPRTYRPLCEYSQYVCLSSQDWLISVKEV